MTNDGRPKLLYAFDPLCGWCYAFRPSMARVVDELGDRVQWEVLSAGLVTGECVRPIADARDYLVSAMATVERATGVSFGEEYKTGLLAKGTWMASSEPPCRAMYVVQHLVSSDAAIAFASEICAALYRDGRQPDTEKTVRDVAIAVGLDPDPIVSMWSAEEGRELAKQQLERAHTLGIRSYPAIYVETNRGIRPVLRGYEPPDAAIEIVRSAAG